MIVTAQTSATEYGLRIEWAVVFVVAPVCGLFGRQYWRRLGRSWRIGLGTLALISVSLASLALFSPWSLRGFWPDAINLGMAYVSLSTALWVGLKKLPRWVSLSVPILANVAFALVGFVGLAFASDEIPFYDVKLNERLSVKTYLRGFAGNDFDQIHVVYRYRWFPFLERTIYDRSVDIGKCGEPAAPARVSSNSPEVEILCDAEVTDRVHVP